jgi:hypothetical protein
MAISGRDLTHGALIGLLQSRHWQKNGSASKQTLATVTFGQNLTFENHAKTLTNFFNTPILKPLTVGKSVSAVTG